MQYIPFAAFIPLLLAIAWFDYKYHHIPNYLTYFSIIPAFVLHAVFSTVSLPMVAAGGVMAFILAYALSKFVPVGGGDIKLMVLIGLIYGLPLFLAVVFGGFMIGGLAMLVAKLAKQNQKESPFGVHLAIAGVAVSCYITIIALY